MRRLVVLICALAMLAAACGEQRLGRRIPECEGSTSSIGTTVILTAQAVPSAEFIPCVEALRPGWSFNHVQARSGQAYFTIDSDRMGSDFLRVTLLPSCDLGSARTVESDESNAELAIEMLEDSIEYSVVVIPVADRHRRNAAAVTDLFTGYIVEGRIVVAELDDSDRSISQKVEAAHVAGRPVFVIDDAEVESATVSLRRIGADEEVSGLDYTEAMEAIEGDVDEPAYRARWYYVFPGGCVRYDIDAKGEGAQTVDRDVARAIGLYPMEELRQLARDAGYRLFE